jgi:SSXT protein (N-terminal region)
VNNLYIDTFPSYLLKAYFVAHWMNAMAVQNESVLLDFQKLLEHNEHILAAIVENLQLGRMEDCISHYLILQSNLVSLGSLSYFVSTSY